jgi:hypothetical protein
MCGFEELSSSIAGWRVRRPAGGNVWLTVLATVLRVILCCSRIPNGAADGPKINRLRLLV